ncbi:hypothetical protein EHS25_004486 [Saitozyma podzolica]|uniref:mRNA stability protein n=1 Tax=Saitozyma podzolica TaxID=1890683 RepID=A0A427YUK8_9TREE|nr:hypothetical protein EHS25_004486 [Saitozyma podzolica]
MSEQDQKAFKMYGKVPGKNLLTKMQKDRKYFDSGDYMMSKAGVPTAQAPGTTIPTPEGVPHASPPSNGIPVPGILATSPGSGALPSPGLNEQGPTERLFPIHGVGVGISPQATSEAIEMPAGFGHMRRGSESHRTSPPGTLREGSLPSSFPIHHPGTLGSSPVKTSALAKRLDEEMEG